MGQFAQCVLGLCYVHGLFCRIPAYHCPATSSVYDVHSCMHMNILCMCKVLAGDGVTMFTLQL